MRETGVKNKLIEDGSEIALFWLKGLVCKKTEGITNGMTGLTDAKPYTKTLHQLFNLIGGHP